MTRQLTQFLILLFLIESTCFVCAGEVDRRFEGIWVGVETFQIPAMNIQKGEAPFQKPVIIAVGEKGMIMAVVQGFGSGRYDVLAKSNGDTLSFRRFGTPSINVGRVEDTLTLLPDRNTLKEKGMALLPGTSFPVTCNITATLHRQDKR